MYLRRRYFCNYRRFRGMSQMCEDLRQSGITAWNSFEYEKAFNSLFNSNIAYMFPMFDFICK